MGAGVNARPVLIAGGGIGGLAVALGLAQNGIRSVLLEKAAALGEIGAGIQLGPNAFHAFDYHVREFNPHRKDTHWGKRKLKSDEG